MTVRRLSYPVKKLYDSAPLPHRRTMLAMRKAILEIAPKAEEVISYGMPAFRLSGNIICGLQAAKHHVGYYPFSGSVLHLFPKELRNYAKTKSALHVPIGKPLSKTLLKKLIQARISQCPIKLGHVDMSRYEELDGYWRSIGLAAPARRGLVDSKALKLTDLRHFTRDEFEKIHGMGPKAISIIRREMLRKKIMFQP